MWIDVSFRRGKANRIVVHGAALALFTAISVAVTSPLLENLTTHVAGEVLDPWQTVWGFWWWRSSAEFDTTAFWSPLLWWPVGTPLWFQTWDIPSVIVASLLAPWLSEITAYNLLLFTTFPLSGFACYLLGRELFGGWLAPVVAGSLYTFSAYHLAHAQAQLHLSSMQWAPLFLLQTFRALRTRRLLDAGLAGLALGFAFLASVYHLVFGVVTILVLASVGAFGARRETWTLGNVRLGLVAVSTFVLVGCWLLVGIIASYVVEPYRGSHDSIRFSADLQAFFVPNAISRWASYFPAHSRWTGTDWETAVYVGYVPLILATFGAWYSHVARAFLVAAGVGAILALGPILHIGGTLFPGMVLPMGMLQAAVPAVAMSGLPIRFAWMTTIGIAIAAGFGVSWLNQRSRVGLCLMLVCATASVVELWPRPFASTQWPTPPLLRDWAQQEGKWAVLDTTAWSRQLWHQTVHRRPIIGGYTSRVPASRWDFVAEDEVLLAFLPPPVGTAALTVSDPDAARTRLQELLVRYVVVDANRIALPRRLGLVELYRGDGIAIFEVK